MSLWGLISCAVLRATPTIRVSEEEEAQAGGVPASTIKSWQDEKMDWPLLFPMPACSMVHAWLRTYSRTRFSRPDLAQYTPWPDVEAF